MRNTIFICILCLSIPLFIQSQNIPNGDFEIWTPNGNGMLQPQHWETQNEPELIFVESIEGHSGRFAANLSVQWDFMFRRFSGAKLTSEFSLSEQKRYLKLLGFFKGNLENLDTLTIEIVLFFENRIIGNGSIKILENSNEWKKFLLPIQYNSDLMPDRASVSISINPNKRSHSLSSYCIDDFLLTNLRPLPLNIANNAQKI